MSADKYPNIFSRQMEAIVYSYRIWKVSKASVDCVAQFKIFQFRFGMLSFPNIQEIIGNAIPQTTKSRKMSQIT